MKQFFKRLFFLSFKIFLGCFFGAIIVLFYASRSDVVRNEIKNNIQQMFKNDYDCRWEGELSSIDLLSLRLEFCNISVTPCDPSHGWSMYADKYHGNCSWIDLLLRQRFSCHGYFQQAMMREKRLEDHSHLKELFMKIVSRRLPSRINFDFLTVKKGEIYIEDASGDLQSFYEYNCQIAHQSDGTHAQFYFLDGYNFYKKIPSFEKLFGNVTLIFPNENRSDLFARADCRLSVPLLQDKKDCFFVGDFYEGRGSFVLSNDDQSFIIEPMKIHFDKGKMPFTCSVNFSVDLMQKILLQQNLLPDLTGLTSFTLKGDLTDPIASLHGDLQLQKIFYKNNLMIDQSAISFYKNKKSYVTELFVKDQSLLKGDFKFEDHWKFEFENSFELQPWWGGYWKIAANKGFVFGDFFNQYEMQGSYDLEFHSDKLDALAKGIGSFDVSKDRLRIQGDFQNQKYDLDIQLQPTINLICLLCFNEQKLIVDFHEDHAKPLKTSGFVDFDFIKNLLQRDYKSSFSQSGQFSMEGQFEKGIYTAMVTTQDAYIRIPYFYNVVQDFKATTKFDFVGRQLIIEDMIASLYEGTIRCDKAVCHLDREMKFSFMHVPLLLENVLISWHKGIFGIVSGRLFLTQQKNEIPVLQGNVILEKAQLKGNIFSSEFQQKLMGKIGSGHNSDTNCDLNITIETKEPIFMETSFMKAQAHLDLHATGKMKQPQVAGKIDLISGELNFPCKPLIITYGRVYLTPDQANEPTIEMIAKGKIKRYNIIMRALGTIFDQQISFESAPYLTEEQIISLLLVGSEDSSLSVVMPAFFMQKLNEIVFGPAMSKSNLDIMFDRLLQPLKYMRFYPQFTNQTGRGGVRGILEIDATDRLHGRIDSNLMQLEDTKFEVDYSLTDDITVRAIKDGPSAYGGEVEMRWKFS